MQSIQIRSHPDPDKFPKPVPSHPPHRRDLYQRQGGLGGLLDSIFNPGEDSTSQPQPSSAASPRPSPNPSPPAPSSAAPSSAAPSTTQAPSTSSTPTTSSTTQESSSSSSSAPTSTTEVTTSSTSSVVTSVVSSTQADGQVVPVTITSVTVVQATGRPSSDQSGNSSSSSNGALIGGVVGGVVGGLALLIAALAIFFLVRRRKARTGSGWFLCFGTKPENDGDIFDPSENAYRRNGATAYNNGGTLPQGFEDEDPEAYNDMSEYPHSTTTAGAAGLGVGAAGAGAYYGSYNSHQSQPPQSTSGGNLSSNHGNDYSHFDPPEVRAERAREAAAAAAVGRSQASHNSGGSHPPILVPGSLNRRANSFGQSNDDHSLNGPGGAGMASPPAYADAPEPLPNSREAAVLDDDDDYLPQRPAALGIANPDNDDVDDDAESSRQHAPTHNHLNKDLPPTSTYRRE